MAKCEYFLANKRRTCRFGAAPGQRFCGNHLGLAQPEAPQRIPCPWDPSHTILESDLGRHRRKCNALREAQRAQEAVHFVPGINDGGIPGTTLLVGGEVRPASDTSARVAFASALGPERLLDLIARVEAAAAQICPPEEVSIAEPPPARPHIKENQMRPYSAKHAAQQASIVGNMQAWGLLDDAAARTYVEFGAGRGYLTAALADCSAARRLVLVDVRSFRLKADRSLRHLELQRLLCDIKDFAVERAPQLEGGSPWVAHGKHLCGAATDFTLRACVRAAQQARQQPRGDSGHGGRPAASSRAAPGREGGSTARPDDGSLGSRLDGRGLRGLAVATCCHHSCGWASFVGKEELEALGFTPQEFELISWMTGWALCGHEAPAGQGDEAGGSGREDEQQPGDAPATDSAPPAGGEPAAPGEPAGGWRPHMLLPRAARVRAGQRCKALLDAARLRWLRRSGFRAALLTYVAPEVSGENRLLLAVPEEAASQRRVLPG